MDRKAKLTLGLDLRCSSGIEIGPLASPIVTRDAGDITYVDYADTESLRSRYANDPHVRTEDIVTIDAIWGDKTLAEAVGSSGKFDYVVACHVVEHVPDLIAWLNELCEVINGNGQIRLIVPDKRYSFDYLRSETRAADVISAHLLKARIPQPHEILDFTLNKTDISTAEAWNQEIDPSKLPRDFTFEGAMWLCRDAMENGTYHDVHCWVFTPKSFAKLMYQLCSFGLIDLKCSMFHDTEHGQLEFFVGMQRSTNRDEQLASWMSMEQSAMDRPRLQRSPDVNSPAQASVERSMAEKDAEIARLSMDLNVARLALSEMSHSRSWKVTAPLRQLARVLRRSS